MNGVSYAKMQLEQNFNLLNMAAAGVDDAQYNYAPQGTCNPISKTHVHALTGVDFFLLNKAKGDNMMWSEFAPKHGLPAAAQEIWGFQGNIPMAAVNEFGQKVQKGALDYVATLSDADLDRVVDTQFFGQQSVAFLIQLVAMHAVGHAGDISSVKGMQGLKGLPF